MDKVLLNSSVIIYLISEVVLLVLISLALFFAIKTLFKWDFDSFSKEQFELEKRSFFQATIINILLYSKIVILIYFIYTIDSLSLIVPGAMCSAGVISANSYGLKLLFFKIVIIFLLLLWVNLHNLDIKRKNYPIIKVKSSLLIFISLLFVLEFFFDIKYFTNIDINLPVSCCSALFGQLEGQNPLPFNLNITMLLILFYILYISSILFLSANMHIFNIILSTLFIYIAYYSVVYFFGTYIYELPTHKCPFCMMQKEYYYVGYLIWTTLFIGGFLSIIYSLIALFFKENLKATKRVSMILLTIFVLISTSYVVVYYFKNGVFL